MWSETNIFVGFQSIKQRIETIDILSIVIFYYLDITVNVYGNELLD